MPVKQVINGKNTHVKVYTDDLEDSARLQLENISQMPFIHHHVAAMPDVHWGLGATIGSVVPTKGAIIPAAVGVDIGCGMMAYRLNLTASDLPDNLGRLRSAIERRIPHGRTDDGGKNDRGGWGNTPSEQLKWWTKYGLEARLPDVIERHKRLTSGNVNTHKHLGTLGTGNHFIEICLDENDSVWVMLHSGSRGIGNRIGSYFIKLAKQDMEQWFIQLPDKNLAYLAEGTRHFKDYIRAVEWAQDYARDNRRFMMEEVLEAITEVVGPHEIDKLSIQCHHNYIARERHWGANVWVTRKGAVRAQEGDFGIIPGSMGAKSYIVEGLGNRDSLCSCSHGAGRAMSRTAARKKFTAADLAEQTAGIECRKDIEVVDEIPAAYKDIDVVMKNQNDLVKIIYTLKQVLNVKG